MSISRRRTLGTVALGLLVAACDGGADTPPLQPLLGGEVEPPVIDHSFVSREDRRSEIGLMEDLVVGATSDELTLSAVGNISVGDNGHMFITDTQNTRVVQLDHRGELVRVFGGPGEGPGEYQRVGMAAVSGNQLVVTDPSLWELSSWSLSGAHQGEVRLPYLLSIYQFIGMRHGRVLSTFVNMGGRGGIHDDRRNWTIGSLSGDDSSATAFVSIPRGKPTYERNERTVSVFIDALRHPRADYDRTNHQIYVATMRDYEVWKLAESGEPEWILRAEVARQALPDEAIEQGLQNARQFMPMISASEIDWPSHLPALTFMGVDGHGHIYIAPYPTPEDREAERLPVDVYSSTGERLFAGWMPNRFGDTPAADGWITAWSDYVYGLGVDQVHGEATMVRYRLIEPF